jgi:hypothetical protein
MSFCFSNERCHRSSLTCAHVCQRTTSDFTSLACLLSHHRMHNPHSTAMAPRAAGAVAPQAPSRSRGLAFPLVVALLAFASCSSSSPLLPRPLGLGFVPSPQQNQQASFSSSSSSSCCGGRHHASTLHPHTRPASATTKIHALPPFDSPLDPATLESMAAAASSAARTGGALNEVTPEQLWVRLFVCVYARC